MASKAISTISYFDCNRFGRPQNNWYCTIRGLSLSILSIYADYTLVVSLLFATTTKKRPGSYGRDAFIGTPLLLYQFERFLLDVIVQVLCFAISDCLSCWDLRMTVKSVTTNFNQHALETPLSLYLSCQLLSKSLDCVWCFNSSAKNNCVWNWKVRCTWWLTRE